MKVTIEKNEKYKEPEIIVRCDEIDGTLQDIISYIGIAGKNIIGQLEGETFFIPLQEVFYFESVDNSVFIYTQKQVFKSTAKLYILEEQLAETPFARISKNTILNLRNLQSVRPVKNARLEGTLLNGEKTVISRQYVQGIKRNLGV